jgi:hypothetical protein
MFDLEANKAIALRGSRFSTAADSTCLTMRFIPSSAGADSQPSRRWATKSDLVLGESSTRCSIKRCPTREPRRSTLSRKATRS